MGRIIGMNDVPRIGEEVIFLTGPNRCAPVGWRQEAAKRIVRRTPAAVAFTDFSAKVIHPDFKDPLSWGVHHRNYAMNAGMVMFWFPEQKYRIGGPSSIDPDFIYAANALHDFGRCCGECVHRPLTKMVVGCEKRFAKCTMLADRLRLEETGLSLFEGNLEDFCDHALTILGKRKK